MKHTRGGIAMVLALALCACGVNVGTATARSARAVAGAVVLSQDGLPELTALEFGGDGFDLYLENYYGLNPDTVEDGVIRLAGGVEAAEIAVLLLEDTAALREARESLEDYLVDRAGDFAGYAPEQAAMVENAGVASTGHWVALLICPDPEAASEAFLTCFDADWTPPPAPEETVPPEPKEPPPEEPSPAPETEEDPYDPDAVLAAWRAGDASGLSEKNRAILDAALGVLAVHADPELSDYEKELAVHDWMIDHGEYDPGELSHLTDQRAEADPDNDNPYGFLLHGKGVCLGYSSTFQLFMDLLGIECITVHGSAYEEREEHAWNMVRLDGEWYCVDVTWDDPVVVGGGSVPDWAAHEYFNCTSEHLRQTQHYWDEDAVPEASATAWAWRG